ncbi:hypothetical protein LguiA_029615 [Lonicera macranthoides]
MSTARSSHFPVDDIDAIDTSPFLTSYASETNFPGWSLRIRRALSLCGATRFLRRANSRRIYENLRCVCDTWLWRRSRSGKEMNFMAFKAQLKPSRVLHLKLEICSTVRAGICQMPLLHRQIDDEIDLHGVGCSNLTGEVVKLDLSNPNWYLLSLGKMRRLESIMAYKVLWCNYERYRVIRVNYVIFQNLRVLWCDYERYRVIRLSAFKNHE